MTDRSLRLLIFDWDGTLLDSVATIVSCVQATLSELGEMPAEEESIRASIGLGLRETVDMFRPGCDDELFDQVVAVYRRLWSERFAGRPALFAGVGQVLQRLREDGFLLAIATAKSRGGLRADLSRTGLASMFSSTRTMDEAPSKPDPSMVFEILQELNVTAQESLMIGDTTHDLAMAANAGVTAVAVCSGCESRQVLERRHPAGCLDSVIDLPRWLEGELPDRPRPGTRRASRPSG
ncbi:MAG: HAD-IA family hydrolase [Acidobacteriota bacterium]|nr:HAD-IA family hydrolase [Acidobacteriota bacterium]